MRLNVQSDLGDLEADLTQIKAETPPRMRGVVRDGLKVGTNLARTYAREQAGPHGKNYFKRISSEMHGTSGLFGNTISGEYGPSNPKTEFIGAGFRNGHNTDLARSADIVGPAFLRSVDDAVGEMFKTAGF